MVIFGGKAAKSASVKMRQEEMRWKGSTNGRKSLRKLDRKKREQKYKLNLKIDLPKSIFFGNILLRIILIRKNTKMEDKDEKGSCCFIGCSFCCVLS